MSKKERAFGLIGLLSSIAGFLAKTIFRDYINLNAINDFGMAGLLPSYFYVVGFSRLLLMRLDRTPRLIIFIVTLASILFEFKQYAATGVFDTLDVFASIIGGLTSVLIVKLVQTKIKYAAGSTT